MTARLSGTDLALKPLLCSKVPVISRLLKYKLCPPPFVCWVLLSWQLVDPYRYESTISSIGVGLAPFQDGRHSSKMAAMATIQDGVRRPGDAFGVTSKGELTP